MDQSIISPLFIFLLSVCLIILIAKKNVLLNEQSLSDSQARPFIGQSAEYDKRGANINIFIYIGHQEHIQIAATRPDLVTTRHSPVTFSHLYRVTDPMLNPLSAMVQPPKNFWFIQIW